MFQKDPATEAIVMIGEIGGTAEEEAAAFIKANVTKPVVSYIAGRHRAQGQAHGPCGRDHLRRQGHGGREVCGTGGAGVKTVRSLAEIGSALKAITGW